MKILVTGAAGFIGYNLIEHMIGQGVDRVVGIDKLGYASNVQAAEILKQHPGSSFYQVNICQKDAIRKIFAEEQPDFVIHLAAESHVDRSIDDPEEFIQTNIVGTYRLLDEARHYFASLEADRAKRFRFLHVSTDEVFGSLGVDGPAFTEQSRYQPKSPYSASKAAADHLARAWFETYALPVIVSNGSNNYGPWQFPDKLIPLTILKAIHFSPIPVYGDGSNVRDWIHVGDHAEALLLVLKNADPGTTYNIGGNCESANIDLVKTICEILDRLLPISTNPAAEKTNHSYQSYAELIEFVPDRPGHDFRYAINNGKISTEIGWSPKRDLKQGLEATVQWYLDNESWRDAVLKDNYRLQRLGLNR